jgi:hypothetical protein
LPDGLDVILRESPPDLVVRYYSRIGNFSAAIASIRTIETADATSRVFVTEMAEVAISFDIFRRFILQVATEPDLVGILLPSAGPRIRFEVQEALNDYQAAAGTAIELFKTSFRPGECLFWLDRAEQAIEAIQKPAESDAKLLAAVRLQRLFCIAFIQIKVHEFADLNVFCSDGVKIGMVLLSMLHKHVDLAADIISTFDLDKTVIGERLMDALSVETDEHVVQIIQQMEEFYLRAFFRELFYPMVMRTTFVLHREDLLLTLFMGVRDPDYRSRLLLQFGFVQQAATVIFENQLTALMPVLGNYVGFDGKSGIFAKCTKSLQ